MSQGLASSGMNMLPSMLKLKQLKFLTYMVGLNSSGTKAQLQNILEHQINAQQDKPTWHGGRIVSVDMGIRNLAYCVLDVPQSPNLDSEEISRLDNIHVHAWRRKDLLSGFADSRLSENSTDRIAQGSKDNHTTTKIPADAFAPSSLSQVAYTTAAELLDYKPNTILIERQRFRSSSAPSIQEWTLRVNMLESMLWACFETMRRSQKPESSFPPVQEVSPARMVHFWTSGFRTDITVHQSMDELLGSVPQLPSSSVGDREKVDKKFRINMVRQLLHAPNEGVSLSFSDEAAKVADGFRTSGKLDDLADCMLQGIAWTSWQQNTRHLLRLITTHDDG